MYKDIPDQIGYIPQFPVCDKSLSIEVNSDFSLPDYQPEIRRLLSTRVSVLPPSEYVGNDSAEFSGDLCYRILYVGSDNSLYSTTLTDRYVFSTPFEPLEKAHSDGEYLTLTSARADSVSTRVLAPRKLSVRCKLRASADVYSPALMTPKATGVFNDGSVQNLIESTTARSVKKYVSSPIPLTDFISLDSPAENARLVLPSANVLITECSASSGKVNCKGEIYLKLVYCNDSESDMPLTMTKKIPFSHYFEDDVDSSYECRAMGFVNDESFDIEENGINCELYLTLLAEAQKNTPASFIKDCYSTDCDCESSYESISLPVALKCMNGNLTQSESVRLADVKLSPDAKIIDVSGASVASELTLEANKLITKGECSYQVIYYLNDEYGVQEFTLPFKYECDCRVQPSSPLKWRASVGVISSRARSDDEKLYLDSELAISLCASGESEIQILEKSEFGDEISKDRSEMVICYPEKGESLWNVAKHYNETVERIKIQNSIPDGEQTIKKKYLII